MNLMQRRLGPFLLCAFLCAFYPAQVPAAADDVALIISNQSSDDLLNIRFRSNRNVFFVRLDMSPGARDEIENPGGTADLRLDTGLALCIFKAVPIGQARRLTFCGDHAACLILDMRNKVSRHFSGQQAKPAAWSGQRSGVRAGSVPSGHDHERRVRTARLRPAARRQRRRADKSGVRGPDLGRPSFAGPDVRSGQTIRAGS